MTSTERALLDSLLDSLLDRDVEGAEQLREQARHATASTGCECGCVTVDLHVPAGLPVPSTTASAPVEGTVLDADGTAIGGVVLYVEHGRLAALEVYSYDEPVPLPAPERVRRDTGELPEVRPSWWSRLRTRRRS